MKKTMMLLLAVTVAAPCAAMQSDKDTLKTVLAEKQKPRKSCCEKLNLKNIAKVTAGVGVWLAAVVTISQLSPEMHPGCPRSCNNLSLRDTHAVRLKMIEQCNSNTHCPKIGYESYIEKYVKDNPAMP